MKTLASLSAAILVIGIACLYGLAQEPSPPDTIDQLRGEITELGKQIADLTKRIEELEYQRLPGIRNTPPQSSPPSGFLRPGAVPSSEPAGSKLLFPYGIERGSAAPLQPRVPQELKLERPRR